MAFWEVVCHWEKGRFQKPKASQALSICLFLPLAFGSDVNAQKQFKQYVCHACLYPPFVLIGLSLILMP